MIYLLHGEDQFQSRQNLYRILEKIKTDDTQLLKFSFPKIDPDRVDNFINTSSLFESKKIIFFQNLFSLPAQKLNSVTNLINQNQELDVLIWESKTITPGKLKKLKNPKILYFAVPKTIFKFLDSLKPQNAQYVLKLFSSTLETQPPELINYFLKEHFRLLIMAREKNFSKTSKLPSWRQSKLVNQAKFFTPQTLKGFYNQLVTTEYKQKTGKLDSSLGFHLTLLVISLTS